MRWKKKDFWRVRRWFAWYPVEINGQIVWLEWIFRARDDYGYGWDYFNAQ